MTQPPGFLCQASPRPRPIRVANRMTFLDLQAQAQSTVIRWRSEFILGSQSCNGEGNHWLGRVGGEGLSFFPSPPPRHLFPTITPRGMKLRWVPSEKKALLRSTGGGCVAVPPVWLSCRLWSSASGETQGESSASPPHPGRTFR